MYNKELIKEATNVEKEISELISKLQTKYNVTVTDIKLDHTLASGRFASPMKTNINLEIKLK